ncbi:uncharacterized protein BO72DRAFT_473050 [Aspergillus fijiensis CBS 313.89]|uniref:C2H2-type domain-containing protein n=1 Tax=Aspergillus fijiensis CBS 313.89 TaxID=1448319 RepID=A0A8G1VU39_9EURO|nr:uncharacterized protein BO72DRAFT_473050 [Aspergillus fijiensis CBS 313.89]RAK71703.1 hypothetical protein BO72DRAFT_473050 [Aspergillus fijiensis CBS 313.89]
MGAEVESQSPEEPTTPSQLLSYLPTYRVLVCLRCRYAIQPGAIARHLKEIHYLSRATRRTFVAFAAEFELAQPQDIVLPDESQFPVPFLSIQEGLACRFERCGYLCATSKRMKQHWRCTHQIPTSNESTFSTPVPLQTFFRGNALRYFTNPSLLVASPASPSEYSVDEVSNDGRSSTTGTTPATSTTHLDSRLLPLDQYSLGLVTNQGLLDHYRHSTYKSLSISPETDHAFGEVVLGLTPRFEFLRQGVMACAALHLASIDPANRTYYVFQSLRHQDQAIPAFRQAILHVDRDNCEAVLAFAFFLVICSLNSDTEDPRLFLSDDPDQHLHWINILRNGCSMLCLFWDALTAGPLAPFAALWEDDLGVGGPSADGPEDPLLGTLLAMVVAENPAPEVVEEHDAYRAAAVQLAAAGAFLRRRGPAASVWDALNAWPLRVAPAYLTLLKQDRPGALLLLAYYAILLRPTRGEWFLAGRVERLIDEIARRLKGTSCSAQLWEWFLAIRREYFPEEALRCQ